MSCVCVCTSTYNHAILHVFVSAVYNTFVMYVFVKYI